MFIHEIVSLKGRIWKMYMSNIGSTYDMPQDSLMVIWKRQDGISKKRLGKSRAEAHRNLQQVSNHNFLIKDPCTFGTQCSSISCILMPNKSNAWYID